MFKEIITTAISYATLFSHVVLVFFVLVFIFRKSWGKKLSSFVGKNTIFFGFIATLVAVLGSLFWSDIVGFPPCVLCWWQRVLIFPQLVLFLVALKNSDRRVFNYVLPLSIISAVIALYQLYANLGGASLLPCTAVGGACSKVFILEFT